MIKRILNKYNNIPFFVRKKIKDRAATALMIIILLLTLFPIVWMVFSSFKGNNEILEGKVAIDHASTSVIFTHKDDKYFWIGTADGAINKYNITTKQLVGRKAFRAIAPDFANSDKYIWLSSANKGLIRIDKENLQAKRFQIPWGMNMDISKVSKTILNINKKHDRLYVSIGYGDFGKVIEYDISNMVLDNVYDIIAYLPFSFDRMAISTVFSDNDHLYVASNRGLTVIDIEKKVFIKNIVHPDFAANDVRISSFDDRKNTLYLASIGNVYKLTDTKLTKIYTTITETGIEQILSIYTDGNKIFLGTGQGIILLDINGKLIKKMETALFDDVDEKGNLINPGKKVKAEVLSIKPYKGNILIVSSSVGRFSFLDMSNGTVLQTILDKNKGFLNVKWRNYIDVWSNIEFGLFLRNSFIVCGTTMIIAMILATFTAYALVRFDFPGSKLFSTAILSTQRILLRSRC